MYLVTSDGRDLSECGRDSVFLATLVDQPTQLHSTSGNFLTGHVVEQLDTNGRGIALFRGSRTRYREDEAEDRSTTVSGWFNGTGVV